MYKYCHQRRFHNLPFSLIQDTKGRLGIHLMVIDYLLRQTASETYWSQHQSYWQTYLTKKGSQCLWYFELTCMSAIHLRRIKGLEGVVRFVMHPSFLIKLNTKRFDSYILWLRARHINTWTMINVSKDTSGKQISSRGLQLWREWWGCLHFKWHRFSSQTLFCG